MGAEFVIALGCFCLGAAIGGIVAHYIARVDEFNLRALTSIVGIFGGAGVLGVFTLIGTPPSVAYWFYPVGILVGLITIALLHWPE
jgi:hypothetical protein